MCQDMSAYPADWTFPSRTGPTALLLHPVWSQEAQLLVDPLWKLANSYGCKTSGTFTQIQ